MVLHACHQVWQDDDTAPPRKDGTRTLLSCGWCARDCRQDILNQVCEGRIQTSSVVRVCEGLRVTSVCPLSLVSVTIMIVLITR